MLEPAAERTDADILLTHGYFIAEDLHEQQVMKPYPRWDCSTCRPI
ncbi:MAG: hypothetical protein IPJ58_04560 [Ardenticatenia bacterium]|nr:hypothetical protein [Ardenticatenia bacterium]